MPYFRIVLWLTENRTVRVVRGIRFYDMEIDNVRWQIWNKAEEAFKTAIVQRVDVEQLPNDSRSLKKYLLEEERQRLEAKVRNEEK